MRDWQAELDELFKQTASLVGRVDVKAELPRVPPQSAVEPVDQPALPKSGGSQREEIIRRVATFRAHQQRAIRDREQYATSVLMKMRATLRTWS
jgi:hypothetical protein